MWGREVKKGVGPFIFQGVGFYSFFFKQTAAAEGDTSEGQTQQKKQPKCDPKNFVVSLAIDAPDERVMFGGHVRGDHPSQQRELGDDVGVAHEVAALNFGAEHGRQSRVNALCQEGAREKKKYNSSNV